MQWLPVLRRGTAEWRLPLADPTAALLAEAFLADTSIEGHRYFVRALSDDPAFALWTTCVAEYRQSCAVTASVNAGGMGGDPAMDGQEPVHVDAHRKPRDTSIRSSGGDPPTPPRWPSVPANVTLTRAVTAVTLSEFAAWLAKLGGMALDWTDEELAGGQPTQATHELEKRFAELAADSLTRAQGQPADRYLLCLLANISDWLSATGPPANWSEIEMGETCVPPQCAEALRDVCSSSTETETDETLLAEQHARWSANLHGAGRQLRSLVRRLRRLQELEGDFGKTLETEKLNSLKQFAYGAGHEINNPLANISTRAQTLLGEERDPERRRKLATINSQAFRAHEMLADLMLFAQPPPLNLQPVNLVETARLLVEQMGEQAATRHVLFHMLSASETVTVTADPDQLQVALRAICTNALDAIPKGGAIEIELDEVAETQIIDEPRFASIQIRDTGPGIPADVRRHVFDPFFSGREAGRGIGFGLSKCWRIITDHGGSIVVDSQLGSGASFTIMLPKGGPIAPTMGANV